MQTPGGVLAIGYGNPGRLDDGLGVAMADALDRLALPGLTVEADYQLTVEDAEAVARHGAVVFIDASVDGPAPFEFRAVEPDAEVTVGYTSHHLEPSAVLALARDLFGATAPGYTLGVRGYVFDEFGEGLSPAAQDNLAAALSFLAGVLRDQDLTGRGDGADGREPVGQGSAMRRNSAHQRRTNTGAGAGGILTGGETMQDGKHVILVVDDDPDVRDALALILAKGGYVVVGAASAEEGLRTYRSARPDLVVVDLMMEEVDSGTSFVKELRLLGNTAPIYMLSSVGDALHKLTDYTALGLDGVFQKPIDPAALLATLQAKLK